jgi:hypothetical protein
MSSGTSNNEAGLSSVVSTYNAKKCVFLYYDSLQSKFTCVQKPFILTITGDKIVGQFITTNWFTYPFSTNDLAQFMVVWVDDSVYYDTIEHDVKYERWDEFYSYEKFSFVPLVLQDIYQDLKNVIVNEQNKSLSIDYENGNRNSIYSSFSLKARMYYNSQQDNYVHNTLLLSLPSFELTRTAF